jgi:hypothetical protein
VVGNSTFSNGGRSFHLCDDYRNHLPFGTLQGQSPWCTNYFNQSESMYFLKSVPMNGARIDGVLIGMHLPALEG